MPTTRRQAAQHNDTAKQTEAQAKPASRGRRNSPKKNSPVKEDPAIVGQKRKADENEGAEEEKQVNTEQPPQKKSKTEDNSKEEENHDGVVEEPATGSSYQTGTIERGHIYFFYRPRVELEEAHALDDVQRFYMLLVPRPPSFSTTSEQSGEDGTKQEENSDMKVLSPGADAVPAPETTDEQKKHFRLLVVGKKSLPDPEAGGSGKGSGRNQVFWATITTIGEDLIKLQEGLGEKEDETKTRGTRHQGPARLAARGAYAIVNTEAATPSKRETHLGYHLSHPPPDEFGDVQAALGIHIASSFVLQVKNPLAPPTGAGRVGLPSGRTADYPEELLHGVFGKGGERGRESFGLRFASVERRELLDYEGVELLFIAARSGDEGLETSLGEGRGTALTETEEKEGRETIEQVLKELAIDSEKIPADPLEGQWA
ncbi:hypothetical protein B0H21DRAFT_413389 [Amylocystis lapponica]|nr:hypothetical protein B0H21DRAFT_413389 [Amylocystis lapponica]